MLQGGGNRTGRLSKWLKTLPAGTASSTRSGVGLPIVRSTGWISFTDLTDKPRPPKQEGAAAVRLISYNHEFITRPDIRPALEEAVADASARVRLEGVRAIVALQKTSREDAILGTEAALRVIDKPMDRVLDYALWLTVRELEPYWLPEFQAGKLTFGGDAKKLAFALSAVGNKDTVKPVVALIDGGKVPKENVHGLYLLLAQIGGPEELAKVLKHAVAEVRRRCSERNCSRRRKPRCGSGGSRRRI